MHAARFDARLAALALAQLTELCRLDRISGGGGGSGTGELSPATGQPACAGAGGGADAGGADLGGAGLAAAGRSGSMGVGAGGAANLKLEKVRGSFGEVTGGPGVGLTARQAGRGKRAPAYLADGRHRHRRRARCPSHLPAGRGPPSLAPKVALAWKEAGRLKDLKIEELSFQMGQVGGQAGC